jgi:hypothetical protein
MSDEKNRFWEDGARRLGQLFTRVRSMVPNCPNPEDQGTTAKGIHEALRGYQGNEKEVHHFAKMDPKTFYAIFCEWQRLGK